MKNAAITCTVLVCSLLASICCGAKTNTLRQSLTPRASLGQLERIGFADTVRYADKIVISGYEKTVTDANESFFVTNDTPFHLSRLTLRFVYTYAETGETLHEEVYEAVCDIPPGSTRQVLVRSFDRQHKFYYAEGRRPRRAATPFRLKYTLMSYDVRVTVADSPAGN